MELKNNELYINEGMAIFIKGEMVYGIHPDNLENNLGALSDGSMGFNWEVIKNYTNLNRGSIKNEESNDKGIIIKGENGNTVGILKGSDIYSLHDKNITINLNTSGFNSAEQVFNEITKRLNKLGIK